MRSRTKHTITSREVHDRTAGTIQEHIRLTDHGPKCTASSLIAVLLYPTSRAWKRCRPPNMVNMGCLQRHRTTLNVVAGLFFFPLCNRRGYFRQ